MRHERNVDGLRQNAQKKRQQALEKTEQGIRQLLKSSRPVNFETVAEVAGVSKAWLYRETEIKERIEQLRAQGTGKTPVVSKPKALDASKDAINKTLKERIKRLEAEARELRKHIEVITGQNYVLEEENTYLRKQLTLASQLTNPASKENLTYAQKVTSLNFSEEIQTELKRLGVKVSSTLGKFLSQTTEDAIWKAIEALKQQSVVRHINNPAGFLLEAIRGEWERNQEIRHKEQEPFNQWYPLARSLNLVLGSQEIGGVIHVYTSEGTMIPFKEMLAEYPLKELEQKV
jgi:biotin operon repressor